MKHRFDLLLPTILILLSPFVGLAQNTNLTVGTAETNFTVSPLGGAVYDVTFEAPQGLPGMQPQVKLVYNSMAGNGLAGVGFNLSGISVITRGPRTVWHDGVASGITHGKDDAFFLDGQRLIEQENITGSDSIVYCLESNPYLRVVLFGRNASTQASLWFRATAPDGTKTEFGHTSGGKQSYTDNGISKVNAWYVTRIENAIGNAMTFQYSTTNFYLYPDKISYGPNSIDFTYENRTDTIRFPLEGYFCVVSKRLKSVKTKTGTDVFREYTLNYSTNGDATGSSYSRLANIGVKNGTGDSMNPITFQWNNLPQFFTAPDSLNIELRQSTQLVTFLNGFDLLAVDFNGDGVSDVMQHAFVGSIEAGDNMVHYYNYYYLNLSRTWNGHAYHESVWQPIVLSPDIGNRWVSYVNAPFVVDINGDGFQDVVVPYTDLELNLNAYYHIIMGSDGAVSLSNIVTYSPQHSSQMPLYTTCDLDNDGKSDIILLDKEGVSGSYHCHIMQGNSNVNSLSRFNTDLTLYSAPKKLLSGDFNCDGMQDIMVICSNEYRIFWNRGGGLSNSTFTTTDSYCGLNLADNNIVREGDFNGDGIPDILTNNTNSSNWYFYLGYGNGIFQRQWAGSIPIYDQSIVDDDNAFTCMVYDIDGDGKSDAFLSKAMFNGSSFYETRTYWMLSNGRNLVLRKTASSSRQDDSRPSHYMLGDFKGDGLCKLSYYGYDCFNGYHANTNPTLREYPNISYLPKNGLIDKFTDGLGHSVQIGYKLLTDKTVYTRSGLGESPFFYIKPAVPVVATTTIGNGVAGSLTASYSYQNLLMHQLGRGLLGYTSTSVTDSTLGTTTTTAIERDAATKLVKKSTETTTLTGSTATTENTYLCHFHHNTKALYQSLASTKETDMDGHITNTVYSCDSTRNNIPLVVTRNNYDNAQEQITYSGHVQRAGQYLPTTVTTRRKHPNDSQYFTTTSTMAYNANGQKTSETTLAGTPAAVTTTYSYTTAGNVASTTTTGNGVESITRQYTYDTTNRFLTQSIERGYIQHAFTYDTWGNMLTDIDQTCSLYPLTITNTYDNWGRLATSTSPEGILSTWEWGWDSSISPTGYYVRKTEAGKPWVQTHYDNTDREWKTVSIGPKQTTISEVRTFNNKGLLASVVKTNGNNPATTNYTYDARGRVLTKRDPQSSTTSYTYGSNWSTATKGGRSFTKYYDSWGNVKSAQDPQSTVNLFYNSNGKPKYAITAGDTVRILYDAAGRRTQMTDPSAGSTTYTYDAYGRLLTQTDARGYTTTYEYDERGQLITKSAGSTTYSYTYGSNAVNNGLLLFITSGSRIVQYIYDSYGRMTRQVRVYNYSLTRSMEYSYDAQGRLATQTFPNQLQVTYGYDNYGYTERIQCGNRTLYELGLYEGAAKEWSLGNNLTFLELYDNMGRTEEAGLILPGDELKYYQNYVYDQNTGNLTSRVIDDPDLNDEEDFTYDSLDRLTSWTKGGVTKNYSYENNGNMYSKSGLGNLYYNLGNPYAVSDIENPLGSLVLTPSSVTTVYNEMGQARKMSTNSENTNILYGPDDQRWRMTGSDKALYFDNYEEITVNDVTRCYAYLGNGVMAVSSQGYGTRYYYLMTDHLGSIIGIVNDNGEDVFKATYDPWGKQTVIIDSLHFHRGFTGHEMLPRYDLINMNGRLYDPTLGRFLSPDNYVQLPDFSQSYNRYSYCLNNPLKYTDPNGELFGIDDVIILGVCIAGAANVWANWDNIQHNWEHGVASFLIGAGSAALGIANPVLGAVALGAGNSIVNQSFNGYIDFNQVCNSIFISLSTYGIGQTVGSLLNPSISKLTSKVNNVIIEKWLNGAIDGSISGFTIGTLFCLDNLESIEDVFDNGGKNALHGFIIGSMNGLNRGVYETKIRKAYNEKPYQQHHFATNKNKTYTPEMKRIAEKYNLDLDGDWNKELLPHMGKHPNYYHEWVIEQMRAIDNMLDMNQQKFIHQFEIKVKQPVRSNPEMLYKKYWENP